MIIFLFVMACTTQKQKERFYSEKEYRSQIQKTIDSLNHIRTKESDSIKEKEIQIIQVPYEIQVEADCDSSKFNQTFTSGDTSVELKIINGKLMLKLKKDSTQILYWKDRFYKSEREKDSILIVNKIEKVDSSSAEKVESSKEIIKTDVPWYKKLLSNLWFILFWILFILWTFGITPGNIYKFIKSKFFV